MMDRQLERIVTRAVEAHKQRCRNHTPEDVERWREEARAYYAPRLQAAREAAFDRLRQHPAAV